MLQQHHGTMSPKNPKIPDPPDLSSEEMQKVIEDLHSHQAGLRCKQKS
ncbi:MAG: hypothetical protein HQ542_08490 [Bacteroidia bacterium]|nr:hypothetical protein [Bacteroidia bacterium]